MPEINLPQGYTIRRTTQGLESYFDVYMLAIGLVLITITLLFLSGFLFLPSELVLGLVSGLFLWLTIEHCKHWIQIKKAGGNYRLESWIVSCQGDDVGVAMIQRMKNYVTLRKLEIQAKHQRKGLGTALLKCVASQVDLPIYLLLCKSDLETFFHRLGFVTMENNRIGLGMRRSVSGSRLGLYDLEKIKLPEGFKVEILKGISKWKSQLSALKQFWVNSLYFKAILLILFLIGLLIFSVMLSFDEEGLDDIGLLFDFVRIQAFLLFFVFMILRFYNFLPNHCLKIYANRKTLISACLCWSMDSAELYIFGKCTLKKQDIQATLIHHVAKVVDVPVYLVCNKRHSDFYVRMGFKPISKDKLPFTLKIMSQFLGVGMCYPIQS
jgi:N-acetylglutamate synthase-like GNAT family acetyltransferase